MKKKNFLKKLKESLNGQVPKEILQEQLEYYDRYIEEEISKGYGEKEIIARLGEPRLLAKTIIETQGKQDYYCEENCGNEESDGNIDWNWILGIGIGVLIIILVMVVLFSILKLLLPVIFIGIFGVIIYRLIFQKS